MRGESMFGDERGSNAWIARTCGNGHGVCCGVEDGVAGFTCGGETGIDGVASVGFAGGFMRIGAPADAGFAASFAEMDSGELLVPV
jgi:hypothetical protein